VHAAVVLAELESVAVLVVESSTTDVECVVSVDEKSDEDVEERDESATSSERDDAVELAAYDEVFAVTYVTDVVIVSVVEFVVETMKIVRNRKGCGESHHDHDLLYETIFELEIAHQYQ